MLIDKSRQIVETNASIYLEEARDTTKLSNCWAKYSIYLRGNKIKKPEKATKPLKRRLEKFHAGISLFLRNISVSGNRKREWQSQKLHFPIILFFSRLFKTIDDYNYMKNTRMYPGREVKSINIFIQFILILLVSFFRNNLLSWWSYRFGFRVICRRLR